MALLLTVGTAGSHATDISPKPPPAATERARTHLPAECRDTDPHKVSRITVAPGVELEVLDFGGSGKRRTLVLLTGLGDNAYVY
ncbi:MAG: hypothetical protein ACJ745_22525, partial [Actinomycetes bacterium]